MPSANGDSPSPQHKKARTGQNASDNTTQEAPMLQGSIKSTAQQPQTALKNSKSAQQSTDSAVQEAHGPTCESVWTQSYV